MLECLREFTWWTLILKFQSGMPRDRRTTSTSRLLGTTINWENQTIDHQFKQKSLLGAQFKQELSPFLLDIWQQPAYAAELSKRSLYMTNGEECHLFQVATTDRSHIIMTPVPELRCIHEESSSRLLHAYHAAHIGSNIWFSDPLIAT